MQGGVHGRVGETDTWPFPAALCPQGSYKGTGVALPHPTVPWHFSFTRQNPQIRVRDCAIHAPVPEACLLGYLFHLLLDEIQGRLHCIVGVTFK